MFDTYVTIVGNALGDPERRRTTKTNTPVTNFRIASTSRRFDKATDSWIDGDSLRVKVTCWRRLGEHVAASVIQGDPLIVTGRISTRDYVNAAGEKRTSYELDAVAVGHDLSKGTGRFTRFRPTQADVIDDAADTEYAGGERTETLYDPLEEPEDTDPALYPQELLAV